jgi:hypothetical protein
LMLVLEQLVDMHMLGLVESLQKQFPRECPASAHEPEAQ